MALPRHGMTRWLILVLGISLLGNAGLVSLLVLRRERPQSSRPAAEAGGRVTDSVALPGRKKALSRVVTEGLPPGYRMIIRGLPGSISSICFAPDNSRLGVVTSLGSLVVWNLHSKEIETEIALSGFAPESEPIRWLAFSPSSDGIAYVVNDERGDQRSIGIHILELATGRMTTLRDDQAAQGLFRCMGLAFSPDGRTLAAGCTRGVALFDVVNGNIRATLRPDRRFYFKNLNYSADGARLWCMTLPAGLTGFDTRTGQIVADSKTKSPQFSARGRIVLSPDGRRIALGSQENQVTLWDARTGQEVVSIKEGVPSGWMDRTCWVGYTSDGRALLTASPDDVSSPVFLRRRDGMDGKLINKVAIVQPGDGYPSVYPGGFSPDGRLLALVGLEDGTRVVPEPDMGSISFQEGVFAIYDTSPVLAEPAVPLTSGG
jgi:WD40 repeat protein